jgi:hypothetical protein
MYYKICYLINGCKIRIYVDKLILRHLIITELETVVTS